MTESQNSQFVLKTKFQRQPVKLSEDGCNMLVLSLFSDETGRTVLNSLKTIYLIRSDTFLYLQMKTERGFFQP